MAGEGLDETDQVDFFISYTGADVAWAEWVAFVLEDAGQTTLLQVWDFRPGSNFALEMHKALQRSSRVIALLSEPYLRSAYAAPEWAGAFVRDPQGREGRLVPVRVTECSPDGLLAAIVYIDLVGLEEEMAKRKLLAGVDPARPKPTRAPTFPVAADPTARPQPFPGRLPAFWNVPARNPNFTGRDAELEDLRNQLANTASAVAVLAVSGLGGVGKTQLAIEHAWRRAADYDLVWLVSAEIPDAIAGALAPLAEHLGVTVDEPSQLVAAVHGALSRRHRWLLVFDNAENPDALGPYLPPAGTGHVLVTSRNPGWRGWGATLDLDVWSEDEAAVFLLARTGADDEQAARSVAIELGLLPLALEQAAAYIGETGMTLVAYRRLLADRRPEVLERGTPTFYRQSVAATFGLVYDRATALSPPAARILRTCAFLAPDDIPIELVATADTLADEDALAVLRRLALVRRHGDAVSVHRLVADIVRARLSAEEASSGASAAIAALQRAFPDQAGDHRSWATCARLLPHVVALASQPIAESVSVAGVLDRAGDYLASRAEVVPSRSILERALAIKHRVYGPDHEQLIPTLTRLGRVIRDVEPSRARDVHARALRIGEAHFDRHDSTMAALLANLGTSLRTSGDLPGARDHLERAVAIWNRADDADNANLAIALVNLGNVLDELGENRAARDLLERAVPMLAIAFGDDDPRVAAALTTLGTILTTMGDLAGALERYQRALAIFGSTLGPDHPSAATVVGNVGLVLLRAGRLAEAMDWFQRAQAILERAHGPDHPGVARLLANQAGVLVSAGDLSGARGQMQKAVDIYEAALGPTHPQTREARDALDRLG